MKMVRSKILVVTICMQLILISCDNSNLSLDIQEMPSSLQEHKFSLADIALDMKIIVLKAERPMSAIYEVKYFEPYFYIKTKDHKLYRFHKNGELSAILYSKGRGPEEYLGINNFHVDNKGDVIINTATERRLMIYDNHFNFKKYIDYPKDVEESYVFWFKDMPYFFPLPMGKTSKLDWLSIDSVGNPLEYRRYPGSGIKTMFDPGGSLIVFAAEDVLYRYRIISDTIFAIDENGYYPVYKIRRDFDDGKRMLSIEEATRDVRSVAEITDILSTEGKRTIAKIFDLGENWIIHFRSDEYETVLFNREENSFNQIGCGKGLPKLHNDLIGAGDFWIRNVIEMDNSMFLVSFMDAYELRSLVESTEFINGKPLLPDKKRKMELLANNLSEDSNPVLMLLELN